MIEIDEAYDALQDTFRQLKALEEGESLQTTEALGRYLASDVTCTFDSPPFSQSAMDGVAFKHGRETYRCIGTIAAGDSPNKFQPQSDECVRIMTGAPVPDCVDTVEMVENIAFDGDIMTLGEPVVKGQHIRHRGENVREGSLLYKAGTRISPGVMAGLISQGKRQLPLKRRCRIAIAATGNEIIDYRLPLQEGQIYNSNGPSMAALLTSSAVSVSLLGMLPDDQEATRALLESAAAEYDLILLSGGVSMGSFDHVPDAATAAGFRKVFHKIRMKPGKPVWFGHHPQGACLFGLPGNPVSVLVGCILYVKPMLEAILSGKFQKPCWASGILAEDMNNHGGLTLFKGVHFQPSPDGVLISAPTTSGSGDIIRFSTFRTLCKIPPRTSLKRGAIVEVLLPFETGIS